MELNPYRRFADGRDPLLVLEQTPGQLAQLAERMSERDREVPRAPGKWNTREIVAHLADCELVFGFRLRQTLAEQHPVIQPFDQDRWAPRSAGFDFGSALRLFTAARHWNLLLVRNTSPDERQRPTTHPERGAMTLWTIVETMAGHDRNHLLQIEQMAESTRQS